MSNGDFDPNKVQDWRTVLHNAVAVQKGDPDYAAAQEWKAKALENIADLESRMGKAETASAQDLGSGAAFGLGAARAMSFGLGDLPFLHTAAERQATQATEAEHPTSTTIGEVAGGSVPYLLSGGSALLPRTLIGAAQGAGLSRGDVGDRAKGAVLGAALSRYAPQAMSAAGKFGRGALGIVGRLAGRAGAEAPAAAGEAASLAGAAESPAARLRGAFPTEEPATVAAPARPPVHPDIKRAVADYRAGKISGDDLRAAMDFADGHVAPAGNEDFSREGMIIGERPGAPEVQAKPISEGPPGGAQHAQTPAPAPAPNDPALPRQYAGMAAERTPGGTVGNLQSPAGKAAFKLGQQIGAREGLPIGTPENTQFAQVHARHGATVAEVYRKGALAQMGKGATLPYYPRGGAAEQAMGPGPATSAPGSVLGPMLQASTKAQQLLQGPPTLAARTELFTLLKNFGPAANQFLQTHLTPAWKAALQP